MVVRDTLCPGSYSNPFGIESNVPRAALQKNLAVNILETRANIDSKKGAELPGMQSKVMLLSKRISNSPSNILSDGLHS